MQYFPTHSRTHSAVGHSPVIGLGTINETSFAATSIPPYEVDPRTAADAGAPVSGMYARNGLWDDDEGDDTQRGSWRRRLSTSTNHTSAGDRRSTKSTRGAATSAGRSRSGTLTNAVATVGAPSGSLAQHQQQQQQQQQQSEPWAWGRKSHAASLSSGSANLVAPTAHSRTSSGVAFPGGPRTVSPMFSSPPPPPMAALASPPMPMPSPYGMHSPHASIHSPALSVFPGSSAMPSPSISSTGATTPTIPVQPELKQKKSRTRLRSTTGKRGDALPEHDLNTPMAERTPLTPIGNVPPIPPAAYPSPYSAKGQTMHPKADGKSAWKRGVEKLWRSKSSSGLRDSFHHKRGASENDPPPPMPALPRNMHTTHQSHSGALGLHSPRASHSGALGFSATADLPPPPAFGASHRDSFDDFGMRPPTARYDTFGVALPSTPEPFEPNDNAAEADPFASAVDFAQTHSRQPSRALPLDLLPPPTVAELSRPPSLHNLKAAFIPRLRKSKSLAAVDGSITRPASMDIPSMPSPRMPTASLHGHGTMSEAHFGAFSDCGHADPLPSLSSPLEIVHLSHDRGSAAFTSPLDFIQRPEFATQTFGSRPDHYSTFGSRTLEPPRPHFHNNSLDQRSQDQVSSSPSAELEPAPIVEAEPPVPPIRTKPRAVDPPMPDPMAPPMSAPPRSHSPPCSLSIKTDFSGGRVGSSGSSAELATPHQPTSAPPTAAGFEPFNEIPMSRARSESLGVDEPPTSPSFYELYEKLGVHPSHIKENRKPKQFPDMDDGPDDFNTDDLNHFNQHFNAAFNDAFLPTDGGDGYNPLEGDLSPSLRSSSWEAAINAFPTIDDSMAMATGPSFDFDDMRANRDSLQSSNAAIAPTESVGSHSYAMHESSGPQQRANPGRSDAGGAGGGGTGGQGGGGSGASSENTSGVWTSWRDVPRRTGGAGGSGQTSGLGGSGRDSRGSSRGSSRERRVPRVDSAALDLSDDDNSDDDSDYDDDDRPLSQVADDVPLSRLHPQASAAQQQRFADKQRRREARRAERERMLRRSKTRLVEAKPASPAPAPIVRSKSTRDPREHRYHSESQPRTRGWDGEGGIPPDVLAGRLERVAIGTPPIGGNLLRVRNPDARQPSPGEPIPRPSSADPGPYRARVQQQQNQNPLPRPPKSPARQGYLTLPADDDRPESLMPSRGGADMQRRPSSGRSAEHQSSTGHGSAERHSSTSHGGSPHDHTHHGYRVASDGDAHLRRQPTSSSRTHRIASEGDQPRSGSPLVVSHTSSPNTSGQPVSRGPSMNAGRSPVPSRPRSHSNAARHHPGASAPTPPSEPIPHRARPVAVRCLVLDKRGNSKTLPLDVYPETTARDVVAAARARGDFAEVMTGPTSGWVVFEIFAELGIERQVRDYESILAVTRGWDPTATKNCLVIKDTMRGIASWARVGGWVHLETKRGKWSKRWLETRGGQIFLSKNEKGKDEMQVNTQFSDTYSCARSQTAPMPYVFAFKRFEPAASFENPTEHVQYVACDDPTGYKLSLASYDARSYTIAMTNPAARQPQPSARPAHAPSQQLQHQQHQPQQQQQRPQRPPPPGGHLIDLYGGHQAFTGKGLLRTHPGGPPVRPS
ncbi:uncharacterized protein LOC62_01G001362 [Vanrija pseudolonga]|uniref:PH domain-containing protein n=1 Tax=Vanrija pseudolonga TaxID=143232 RepID=A0AAF0Y0U0_9TREE|nr:hypothetical protein LOC62_01G001362 [Vanrija pseudolonga]